MKLKYCKPETEVDLLVLENFVLYGITTKPDIDDDMDDPDDITW